MNTTETNWMHNMSDDARALVLAYQKDRSLPSKEIPENVKRDVWLASIILGESSLTAHLYTSKKVNYKNNFTPTFSKLRDWLDLKTDREILFKTLALITKVSKYSAYTLGTSVIRPDDVAMSRVINEWHMQNRDFTDTLDRQDYIKSFQHKVWFALGQEKLNNIAMTCGLLIGNNAVKTGENMKHFAGKGKVTDKAERLFVDYVTSGRLPPKKAFMNELWQLAWASGDTYLMMHLFSWSDMDKIEFGEIMAPVLQWTNMEEQSDYGIVLLNALAVAHDSTLKIDKSYTRMSLSFLEFLVLHDQILGKCFDALWKKIALDNRLEIELANNTVIDIRDKDFFVPCNILNYFKSEQSRRPIELYDLFQMVKIIDGVELSRAQLKALTSSPDSIEAKVKAMTSGELTERDCQGLTAIGNFGKRFHWDTLEQLLRCTPIVLESMVEWMNKLELDLLENYFLSLRNSLHGKLTSETLESARWLVNWMKPQTLFQLKDLNWLEVARGVPKVSLLLDDIKKPEAPDALHLPLTVYPDVRFLGLERHDSSSLKVQIDIQRYPSLDTIEINNSSILVEDALPAGVKTLSIHNYPLMQGILEGPSIALDKQEHIETILLLGNHCYPMQPPNNEKDYTQEFFQTVARMPQLNKLYIALAKWMNLEHLPELKRSPSLKELYVHFYDVERKCKLSHEEIVEKFQPLVGEGIAVSAWTDNWPIGWQF